jgi:hypothetical protein
MVIVMVVSSVPNALVTVRVAEYVPAVRKQILVGFCDVDDEGVPPVNVQFHEVGLPELISLKFQQDPSQALPVAVKEATGGVQVLTVTETLAVFSQPLPSVPVTV